MSDCILCNEFNGSRLVDCDGCGVTTCSECIVKHAELVEGDHGVVQYCMACNLRVVHPMKHLAEQFFYRAGGHPLYFERKTHEGFYERVIMAVKPHGFGFSVKVSKS